MILFYILVLLAPMPNHPQFEEPFAGLTIVKWLGIICCGYACVRLFRDQHRPAFFKSWPARSFVILVLIVSASFVTLSKTDGLSFNPMLTYVSYVLLFFTALAVVDTQERLHRTLLAAIAGAAWASLYVIREFQASGNLRPGYVAGDSNYFAICTVLVIPFAVYFLKMKTSKLERWFCGLSLGLMLIAFTLASSRGGLVGLCVAVAYMLVRSGQSRRAVIVIMLLLFPLLMLSPASPLSRLLHPSYADIAAEQIRRDFWSAGLDMIRNHPLTGVGLGNFAARSYTSVGGKHGIACNTFLEIAAELGFPGFLAYCGIVVGSFSCAGKLRSAGKAARDISMFYTGQAIQAGLLGFLAAAVFVSAEYQKPFWVVVALTATVPGLLARQSRKAVPVKTTPTVVEEPEWLMPAPPLSRPSV